MELLILRPQVRLLPGAPVLPHPMSAFMTGFDMILAPDVTGPESANCT